MPFSVNVGEALSNDSFTGKMKQGVVSKLVGRLPEVKIRGEQFFDLSGRTKGEIVGEADAKGPTPTDHPLRHIRTTKIHYTERFSTEFLKMDEQEQLDVLNTLAAKWLQSDFLRDLDTVILHGINPKSGTAAATVTDYVLKSGSSVNVPSTGTTASAIDTDVKTMLNGLADDGDVTGIAFSNSAASKLAGITENGVLKYPSLGRFGFNVDSFEGIPAASSKEVGEFHGAQVIAGNWDALRYGLAAVMPVTVIEYGDPDGLGDLQRYNQVALRFEAIFGFGVANPNALYWVGTPASS